MSESAVLKANIEARLSRIERQYSESINQGFTKSEEKLVEPSTSEKQILASVTSLEEVKVRFLFLF